MTDDSNQTRYDRYVEEIIEDIADTVRVLGCQPILFIGSGLAKRYMNAPNWDELLSQLASKCSNINKGLGFYKQSLKTPMLVGEEFAKIYQEWAWDKGHNEFPESMFGEDVDSQSYIKFKIAELLSELTPSDLSGLNIDKFDSEIHSLRSIRPHAIITTNYDNMIELLFPDHTPIIGQQMLKGQQFSVGEIYKIHGSVTNHDSIVFTESDYRNFAETKKFLSAKLLTFFNEHPLIFIGYSATDPNIRSILADIDQALPEKGGVIPNVFILEWNPEIIPENNPPREKLIPTENDRSIRVKLIEAADFSWVFDAFAANPPLNDVNPRVLRALIARSYHLVRHDIPKMTVEANFQYLTESVADSESFGKLFGIASISDYSQATVQYPHSATEITNRLGGKKSWFAVAAMRKIKAETGHDIKSCDNKYHRSEKVNSTVFHKYSDEGQALITAAHHGLPYTVDLT